MKKIKRRPRKNSSIELYRQGEEGSPEREAWNRLTGQVSHLSLTECWEIIKPLKPVLVDTGFKDGKIGSDWEISFKCPPEAQEQEQEQYYMALASHFTELVAITAKQRGITGYKLVQEITGLSPVMERTGRVITDPDEDLEHYGPSSIN